MNAAAASGAAALVLAAVHLLARRAEEALAAVPRNRWLSVGGGISIAYVFVHLLPQIAAVEEHVEESGVTLPWLDAHGWVAALAGLIVFYGLEQHARRAVERSEGEHTHDEVGWVHVVSYGGYNALIGYLARERAEEGLVALVLFTIAFAVHFLVNDAALVEDHGDLYRRYGRWIVAAGVLVGWAASLVVHLQDAAFGAVLAFVGGAIVLIVLKEELPDERQSRFGWFTGAAVAYSALLLAV